MNLSEKQKQWIAWIIVCVVLTAVSVGLGVNYPLPPAPLELLDEISEVAEAEPGFSPQGVRPVQFRTVRVLDDLLVEDDSDLNGDLDVDGTANLDVVDIDGAVDLASTLTLSDGDIVVADDIRVTAQTAITVTNGAAFTATGTYQAIQAAGEVTPTITAGTAGDLLLLINTSAQTINIADTGTQMLTAAIAMGQYDVLVLWSDGTNWIEISRANN